MELTMVHSMFSLPTRPSKSLLFQTCLEGTGCPNRRTRISEQTCFPLFGRWLQSRWPNCSISDWVGTTLSHLSAHLSRLLFQRGFFDSIVPLNFSTFTTPHVGEAPFPFTPYIYYWLGSTFLGRTGKQLYCLDTWSNTEKPLLEVMVDKGYINLPRLLLSSNKLQTLFSTKL